MHKIYLSIGSNLGNKKENLEKAIELLGEKIIIEDRSSFYETDPVDYLDQDRFLNMVLAGKTALDPEGLLAFTQGVEDIMKRVKTIKYGPRVIDVDILLFDEINLETENLTIPHPRMLNRSFVLVPLFEIAPGLAVGDIKIADLPEHANAQGIRKIVT